MESEIKQAIAAKKLVEFTYHNRLRVVEPHVLGVNAGAKQLLGYQVRGGSSSGIIPEWRRFDLSEMSGFKALGESFPGRRQNPSGKHSSWDYQIAVVS